MTGETVSFYEGDREGSMAQEGRKMFVHSVKVKY